MSCVLGPLIRLAGGNSPGEGRVEVNYNNEWGTVCDNGWDDTDAGVVCRQLGFGSSGIAIGSAYFGEGLGPILLDSVTCSGDETMLTSCGHLGVGIVRSCSHGDDAGVICSGYESAYFCKWISLLYQQVEEIWEVSGTAAIKSPKTRCWHIKI